MKTDTLFKTLADPTRLRSIVLLEQEGELCVCELTHALGVAQPKISRHLGVLRAAGLVLDRRRGQWIYYRIDPALPGWAHAVIRGAVDGAAGAAPFVTDRAALKEMPNRPGAPCCA
ncbi:MAG: ArsR family transcriptional regulator [Gammaproteobacteria bacterium]|nr:MAG: ArsR family transcriptional regulator [Gammaproteobacteria bacterium]TND05283.1 MAG: ArsR family transcriptional regulator [Gammaproteobacteria bacterium]